MLVPSFFLKISYCALILNSPIALAEVSVEQIMDWIELSPKIDPLVPRSLFLGEAIDNLEPWIKPGLFEELSFSEIRMTIENTQTFLPHESFIKATNAFLLSINSE